MLARFFKKSKPIGYISLLILLLIFIGIHFFLVEQRADIGQTIGVFIIFSLFIFISDFIIRKNHLTPTNFYALFVFILLIGLFPSVLYLSKSSISFLFVLLSIRRVYSIQTKKELLIKLFESGFYLGISFLLYPITIIYVILIYSSYILYIHMINKDLLLSILGFITPIFLVFTYFFLTNDIASFKNITELDINFTIIDFTQFNLFLPLILMSLLVVWALIKNFSNRHVFGVDWKNSLNIVMVQLFLSILLIMMSSLTMKSSILFLFFPSAILIGNLVALIKKYWVKELLLLSLLLVALIIPFIEFNL